MDLLIGIVGTILLLLVYLAVIGNPIPVAP